ncbi:NAD-dependent epimerase/dehydratase family protein [Streptomyces sp. DSM 41987]|uniref:NAD-dependent epimerase/dehydratase family protein n=1 Tax=Streptomyces TaxID=1883 RepID=UPI003616844D
MLDSILVTGGAGFIGRHLARLLHEQGHQVTALDCMDNANAQFGRRELEEAGIATLEGSVADIALMRRLVDSHQTIVHLAAPTVGVEQMLKTPVSQANALNNAVSLAAMLTSDHTMLFSSTSDTYGLHSLHYGDKPMAEDDLTVYESPTVSRWNYSKIKSISEDVFAESAARSTSVRIFNTYGPGFDYPEARRVIPQFTAAVFAGTPMRISGDGRQHRAYCYITDLVEGINRALSHTRTLPVGGNFAVNIGNPDEYLSVRDLADLIADLAVAEGFVQQRPEIVMDSYEYSERFNDTWNRCPDITRAKQVLDYRPTVSVRDGVLKVLEFHAEQASIAPAMS